MPALVRCQSPNYRVSRIAECQNCKRTEQGQHASTYSLQLRKAVAIGSPGNQLHRILVVAHPSRHRHWMDSPQLSAVLVAARPPSAKRRSGSARLRFPSSGVALSMGVGRLAMREAVTLGHDQSPRRRRPRQTCRRTSRLPQVIPAPNCPCGTMRTPVPRERLSRSLQSQGD